MSGAGFEPERHSDASETYAAWRRDGAAILVTGGRTEDDLVEAMDAVFAEHLLAQMPPSKVAPNPELNREGYDPAIRTILANAAETLELHDDGHRGFGDRYPDLLCLLCARQAASGGASFLIDGQRLVDAVAADPARSGLVSFLWHQPIDQTVPGVNAPPPPPSRRPMAARTPEGRLSVRYQAAPRAGRRPGLRWRAAGRVAALGREEAARPACSREAGPRPHRLFRASGHADAYRRTLRH